MPSSYSTRLKLEKQGTNENNGTWGTRLNDSVIEMLDEAISGVTTIAFGTTNGDCTITNNNGATAQGRMATLVLTGAPVSNVALNVPSNEKTYNVRSKHTGSNWIKVRPIGAVLGAETTLNTGDAVVIYTDGNRMHKIADKATSQINNAMLPFVQASTTAAARAVLSVPDIATKAQTTAGSASNSAPTTQLMAVGILHGFKKYTDSSGVANTITVTCNPVPVSYSEIESLYIRVALTNDSSVVNINANTLGNIRVKIAGPGGREDPMPGQLRAGVYYEFVYDPTNAVFICQNPTEIWPDKTLEGLELSRTSTTTYTVGTGFCRNENSGVKVNMTFSTSMTKSLSAWAAGTGNGSLDTGSIASNTWYHVHLIMKTSDGTLDVLLSTSVDTPTMPSGYVARRRLGSIRTDAAAQIRSFKQFGDQFVWAIPAIDLVPSSSLGTSSLNLTLTTPSGLETLARVAARATIKTNTATLYILVRETASTDVAPDANNHNAVCQTINSLDYFNSFILDIPTSTASIISYRLSSSGADFEFSIQTLGWTDRRGK